MITARADEREARAEEARELRERRRIEDKIQTLREIQDAPAELPPMLIENPWAYLDAHDAHDQHKGKPPEGPTAHLRSED